MLKTRIRRVIQKYNNNKNSAKQLLKWTGIAVAIGILFVFLLPIILILAAVIGALILVSLLYTEKKSQNQQANLHRDVWLACSLGFGTNIL
jgi:hypothetical protein